MTKNNDKPDSVEVVPMGIAGRYDVVGHWDGTAYRLGRYLTHDEATAIADASR